MTIFPRLLALLAPLALGGCTAISSLNQASRPLGIYELRTPRIQPATAGPADLDMVVEEPLASGSVATDRILVRPDPLRSEYLPGVRWADPAPLMLQTLLVRSLSDAGGFASVGRRPVATMPDLTVLGDLTDFQAELPPDGNGAIIRVRLVLRLVSERDSRVVASKAFTALGEAPSRDAETIAIAFDRATTRLISEIVPWLSQRAGLAS